MDLNGKKEESDDLTPKLSVDLNDKKKNDKNQQDDEATPILSVDFNEIKTGKLCLKKIKKDFHLDLKSELNSNEYVMNIRSQRKY